MTTTRSAILTEDQHKRFVRETNNIQTKELGIDSVVITKSNGIEYTVINEKQWFMTKLKYSVVEVDITKRKTPEYKLQKPKSKKKKETKNNQEEITLTQ